VLAFTFSAALQRYEDRSQTVVAEANAIGTTYLRHTSSPEMQDEVQHCFANTWTFVFRRPRRAQIRIVRITA